MIPQYLPDMNSFLFSIRRLTVFLQHCHEEAVCAGRGGAGTQTLRERLQASFRPLSQKRNQPGGKTTHTHTQAFKLQ